MTELKEINILLVEDNPTDALLLKDAFANLPHTNFKLHHVERMADTLEFLQIQFPDVILLDLGLPDSQGIDTFACVHAHAPQIPVLVLTGMDDEAVSLSIVQKGAQDYLVKKQVQPPLLAKAVRYAMERAKLLRELGEARRRERQQEELRSMDRLTLPPNTALAAQIYSKGSLRDSAPEEFGEVVDRYTEVLDIVLEQSAFKVESRSSEELRNLADRLGRLQAGPRDVMEVHTAAVRKKIEDAAGARAQAYLEEGRFAVLELMGNLTGYYRHFYPLSSSRSESHE